MTKHILLLAAVLGFIAQSSVFAADPSPSPSPSASAPKKAATHRHVSKKHHKKAAEPATSPAESATPKS
jgi:predicted lipid-binding transport protein (Tim44 family)